MTTEQGAEIIKQLNSLQWQLAIISGLIGLVIGLLWGGKMRSEGLLWWEMCALICVIVAIYGIGAASGYYIGKRQITTQLTQEAVREKAGQWTAGENGDAVFKWLACQPPVKQGIVK